jgi:hypothetical protein
MWKKVVIDLQKGDYFVPQFLFPSPVKLIATTYNVQMYQYNWNISLIERVFNKTTDFLLHTSDINNNIATKYISHLNYIHKTI